MTLAEYIEEIEKRDRRDSRSSPRSASGRVAGPGASDAGETAAGMLDVLRFKLDSEVIAASERGTDES